MEEKVEFWGWHLTPDGGEMHNMSEIPAAVTGKENWTWLHFTGSPEEVVRVLQERSLLPDLPTDFFFGEQGRPRLLKCPPGLVMNLVEPAGAGAFQSLHLWIEEGLMISYGVAGSPIFAGLKSRVQKQGTDWGQTLLLGLLEEVADRMSRHVEELEDRIDSLEEEVIDQMAARLEDYIGTLSALRREMIQMRRYYTPQVDVFLGLDWGDIPGALQDSREIHLRALTRRITLLLSEIHDLRDRILVVQEELNNRSVERTNRIIYSLSIVGSIFLPLTFLTGLFGINVGGIPGGNRSGAFFVFTGAMLVIGAGEYLLFRRNRWL